MTRSRRPYRAGRPSVPQPPPAGAQGSQASPAGIRGRGPAPQGSGGAQASPTGVRGRRPPPQGGRRPHSRVLVGSLNAVEQVSVLRVCAVHGGVLWKQSACSVTVKIKLRDNLSQSVFHRTRGSDKGLGAQRQIQSCPVTRMPACRRGPRGGRGSGRTPRFSLRPRLAGGFRMQGHCLNEPPQQPSNATSS